MKNNNSRANAPDPRGRAQEALRQPEQRMRLHIEQTPLAVIEWDMDFRVLQWNPTAEKIFGFTAAEALGRHAAFILPDTAKAQVERIWQDLLAQKGGYRSTNDNIAKSGRILCCEWYNTPLTGTDGQVIGVASLAQDITERQQELQLFKLSVENSFDAIGMATPEGVHYYQNRAFVDLFGHIGPDPRATLYVDSQVGHEVFTTIMAGGQWSGDVRMHARDGRIVNIFLRAYANKDRNDRIIGLVGIHTDITQRRSAGEELRESRNFLAEIQHLVRIGGFKYDFNAGRSFWSDELYRLLGYVPGSVTPSFGLYFQHVHPDDQAMVAALRTDDFIPQDVECRLVSTDGSVYYTITRNRYELDGAGAPIYLYGSIVDITGRKLAENAVKTSRDNLEKIFQTSPDPIFFSDAAGNIAAVNDAVEKALGYTPQELIGQSYALLAPEQPEDMLVLRQILEDFFGAGFLQAREIIFRKKNGHTIHLECNARVLRDDSGSVSGAVSVMRDITDRKKMEAQLRQSQKMEAIGTLAGGIAHDFNNILAAIMGYTELSLDEAAKGLSVEYNLEQILKSTMRARDLVRQILAFSRKDVEERAPLHISPIIREAVKLLRATLPSTIAIQEHISDQPGLVSANSTQIHQVVMNLCTNAAHAMSENGGVLAIGVQPVVFDAPHTAQHHGLACEAYIKITVSDTGTGISPQILDRIFEPFFTTKDIGKGTGMGLAVAHGIVKSHGGEILVASEPGRGSTFDVLLPQLPDANPGGSGEKSRPARGTERILLVDDEEMLLEFGQKLLKSLGYAPTVTNCSLDALRLFKHDPFGFDLIITDMTMPQMTGDMLAGELIRIRPGMPVIIATGFSEKLSEKTPQELGVSALVMKPLNRLELAQAIRTALDNRAA